LNINVAFFIRHFFVRGTEVSAYHYARYNEELLGNSSYIICFTEKKQREINFPAERTSYAMFKSRFPVIEIDEIDEMRALIEKHDLKYFYAQTHGAGNDIYKFEDKNIWGKCKTIKHCVFDTTHPEGDFHISISETLNARSGTNLPVIPYIVDYLPDCALDLRNELGIPRDAVVLGRHGGEDQFDIPFVHEAIIEYVESHGDLYFLLLNTNKFCTHPRVIYLEKNVDLTYKVKFINTCNAMIHARSMGETFGLAVAEFSIKNKPIITCPCGDLEHTKILGDKAILYTSKDELLRIIKDIKDITTSRDDWNAYQFYNPKNIMGLLDGLVFSK